MSCLYQFNRFIGVFLWWTHISIALIEASLATSDSDATIKKNIILKRVTKVSSVTSHSANFFMILRTHDCSVWFDVLRLSWIEFRIFCRHLVIIWFLYSLSGINWNGKKHIFLIVLLLTTKSRIWLQRLGKKHMYK